MAQECTTTSSTPKINRIRWTPSEECRWRKRPITSLSTERPSFKLETITLDQESIELTMEYHINFTRLCSKNKQLMSCPEKSELFHYLSLRKKSNTILDQDLTSKTSKDPQKESFGSEQKWSTSKVKKSLLHLQWTIQIFITPSSLRWNKWIPS